VEDQRILHLHAADHLSCIPSSGTGPTSSKVYGACAYILQRRVNRLENRPDPHPRLLKSKAGEGGRRRQVSNQIDSAFGRGGFVRQDEWPIARSVDVLIEACRRDLFEAWLSGRTLLSGRERWLVWRLGEVLCGKSSFEGYLVREDNHGVSAIEIVGRRGWRGPEGPAGRVDADIGKFLNDFGAERGGRRWGLGAVRGTGF